MDIFALFPTIALACYLVIFFSVIGMKSSALKKSFIVMLAAHIMWTLGSLGMRFGIWFSTQVWFQVSLLGLYFIPASSMVFSEQYMGKKNSRVSAAFMITATVAYLANLFTGGWMIPSPNPVETESGIRYIYENMGWPSLIPYVGYMLATVYLVFLLCQGVKEGIIRRRECYVLAAGKLLLLLGNLLVGIPVLSGIPVDMAMAIPDAFCIMLLVGMSSKFRTNKEAFRNNNRVFRLSISVAMTVLFLWPCMNFIESIRVTWVENLSGYILALSALAFYIVTYKVITHLVESVFIKDGEFQMLRLDEFQKRCHQTLDKDRIHQLIKTTAKNWLEAEWTELLLWVAGEASFIAENPLPDGRTLRLPEVPQLTALMWQKKQCVLLEELDELSLNQQSLKYIKELKWRGIVLFQPIFMEDEVYALLIAGKGRKRYRGVERRALEMMAKISMDALQNASLYGKVFLESRTDALIGIGNRKYFYEMFNEIQNNRRNVPFSIVMVKLDDLRICNQLYGTEGGDGALKKIAAIIQEKSGNRKAVFRYGATEFVVIMENTDEEKARKFAEEVRLQVMQIDDIATFNQLMLTVSAGVCTAKEESEISEKLLDNCTKALFTAQQKGKNCVVVYGQNDQAGSVVLSNRMFSEYEAVFRALTAVIDAKDHYTAMHSQNVSYYAAELARAMKLNPEEVEIVKEAGLLHDIGKIGIPEAILQKPGRLNEEEFVIMKTHVEQAVDILHHLSGMEYILPAVLGHHEKYDGTGYPFGIKGENIPITGRILNVVDSFDAMMSARPYKPPYPVDFALHQLKVASGTQFDAKVADVFVDLIKSGKVPVRKNGPVK